MSEGWLGLVSYLIGHAEARGVFEAATNTPGWSPPTCAIDATDYGLRYLRAFMDWVTETQWGEPVPPTVAIMLSRIDERLSQ